jgi:L-serine/L-threonine ammonia-lyase
VYLKLDLLQPSGSFKDRGMARLCLTLQRSGGTTRLVSSSGGNAGLAAATVGRKLGMNVDVIVPETTKPMVVAKLQVSSRCSTCGVAPGELGTGLGNGARIMTR